MSLSDTFLIAFLLTLGLKTYEKVSQLPPRKKATRAYSFINYVQKTATKINTLS